MVQWPKQRAWGWYATLIRTPWFCLKILRFRPYGALSVQRHFHRTELWLFLTNKGQFNRFTKIDCGAWHTLAAGDKPVYILELQYGNKVTELDIERK